MVSTIISGVISYSIRRLMMSRVLDIDNFDGKSDMNKMSLTILGKE
jgi:hypothetical protein